MPRDYQDERFSYVVLRRGPRPAAPVGARLVSPAAPRPDAEWLDRDMEDLEALEAEALEVCLDEISGHLPISNSLSTN